MNKRQRCVTDNCNSKYKLYAANGSEIQTFGTKTLELNLSLRRPLRWTFIIANVTQPIIGADFLKYHCLLVDLNAHKLIDRRTDLNTIGTIVKCAETTVSIVDSNHAYHDLLSEYTDITKPMPFKDDETDNNSCNIFHHIETTGTPVHARARPLPPNRYHQVKEEFRRMQEMGICRPSKSEWATPLHVVAKKNGDIRPCGDYRRLNAITKPDRYPVPRLHDFTYVLSGKKVFSKLDINKSYHCIRVAKEDIEKTAIITPFGLFEFPRMTFGLRNASQTFQRFMNNNVLHGLDFLFSFVDDIIIASDTIAENKMQLRKVFERFRQFGITINLTKCEFGKSKIDFLGYEVSAEGIKPLESKVNAILDYPRPETVEKLRQFLGMVNFYRASIPNAASHQASLNEYLIGAKRKDKTVINWNDKAIKDFEQCKLGLKNAVMISHPKSNVPVALMTDASDTCAGAVLQQKVNDSWQPLGYFSKRFTKAQQKYSTYDRELLAIYMAVKHFRYLFEGNNPTIFTDHKPLIYAFDKLQSDSETPRRTRQLLFISEFTTTIRYIEGEKNAGADFLSRIQTIDCPTVLDFADLAQTQVNDTELTQLLKEPNDNLCLKKYFIPNCETAVYCESSTNSCRPYLTPNYRKMAFDSIHNVSHPGIRATRKLVAQRFFWPGLNKDVTRWAKCCISCQKCKVNRHTISDLQQYSECKRFEHVNIDIVGPLKLSFDGNRYLITMIDRCTRWPEAIPVKEITAEVVAKVFYDTWISRFGCPEKLTSDQGRQFESALFKQLLKLMGIKKLRTTPYHPQSNGIVERWHRLLKSALTARLENNHYWCNELPTVLLGLRAVGRSDNGTSPAEYVYGQTLRLPGDFYNISEMQQCDNHTLLENIKNTISKLKPVPRISRDSRALFVHKDLKSCEYVFIRNDAIRPPLTPTYDGPYRVLERTPKVYVIQLPNRKSSISIDRLKPAYVLNEQSETSNVRTNPDYSIVPPDKINEKSILYKKTSSGRTVRPPVRFNL